jgi:hypothetical protein
MSSPESISRKQPSHRRSRVNQRLLTVPPGAVLTSAWLSENGISNKLADYYVRSGWLHRVGDGAFTVQSETPNWHGAVFGLQQGGRTVHPGGRTALELTGHAHFIPMGDRYPIYLFSLPTERLPVWITKLSWSERVRHHRTSFLPADLGLQVFNDNAVAIRISTPERAIFELLEYRTLDDSSYEHANLLFESLRTLRPKLVQSLLEACTSIRVKRLFLHLAEKHDHAWFKQLVLAKVSLGSGKRMLFAGGRFDSKYLITVPGRSDERSDYL